MSFAERQAFPPSPDPAPRRGRNPAHATAAAFRHGLPEPSELAPEVPDPRADRAGDDGPAHLHARARCPAGHGHGAPGGARCATAAGPQQGGAGHAGAPGSFGQHARRQRGPGGAPACSARGRGESPGRGGHPLRRGGRASDRRSHLEASAPDLAGPGAGGRRAQPAAGPEHGPAHPAHRRGDAPERDLAPPLRPGARPWAGHERPRPGLVGACAHARRKARRDARPGVPPR